MNQEELTFREWLPEVNERLALILSSIKEKCDVSESDLDLLEYFHRAYLLGEIPFCKLKPDVYDGMTVSSGFSCKNVSTTGEGIEFDSSFE